MGDILRQTTQAAVETAKESGVSPTQPIKETFVTEETTTEDSTLGGISPIVLLGAGVLAYFLFFKKGKKLF